MFKFIERLQKKPKYVRKQVALGTSGAITFLILLVWLSVGGIAIHDNTASESTQASAISPLKALKDDFNNTIGDLREKFDEIGEELEETLSTLPATTSTSTPEASIPDFSSRGENLEGIDETSSSENTEVEPKSTSTTTGTSTQEDAPEVEEEVSTSTATSIEEI